MARYYFDIHDGAQVVRDDEGSEFDSLEAAVQGAARSAAEIGIIADEQKRARFRKPAAYSHGVFFIALCPSCPRSLGQ
ncbi:hypothetical protein DC522_14455 [Microvirga sp. KLBC 81]|uniref:DUF6894 family protein n=1 Tax=Microvirga sp. KLBC 81 TaxID=1862707 RepID=UPI000D51E6E0|nr:hypothetical protein [Microvirga sp. KLBC 81]PVE23649.1 hypothetical protein DC522_14455 [Microvirga sp. KLBC 81]